MRLRVFSIVILAAAFAGCSQVNGPVKEVDAYGAAMEPVMTEMVKSIGDGPNTAGVAKAAKTWDSKKADLKAKRDAIDAAPQGMNKDWQGLYFKIQGRAREYLNNMDSGLTTADSDAKTAFATLRKDVETTLQLK